MFYTRNMDINLRAPNIKFQVEGFEQWQKMWMLNVKNVKFII